MRALVVGAVEGTQVAVRTIANNPDWEVAGIMTLPPDKAGRHSDFVDLSAEAEKHGATIIHTANCNEEEPRKAIEQLAPDYTFVIGWSQIVGPEFRAAAKGNVVGYHPAPLPRLRGRAGQPWTILLDEKITASTLFWIDDGVDSGDILGQKFFHLHPRENAATLYAKHMEALENILSDALTELAAGTETRQVQDDAYATYATKRIPADGLIDWSQPAADIDRLVRAVGRPYPGAFTTFKDRKITIFGSEIAHDLTLHAMPGQIVQRSPEQFTVYCGDGALLMIDDFEISNEGKLPLQHSVLGRQS